MEQIGKVNLDSVTLDPVEHLIRWAKINQLAEAINILMNLNQDLQNRIYVLEELARLTKESIELQSYKIKDIDWSIKSFNNRKEIQQTTNEIYSNSCDPLTPSTNE